MNRSRPRPCSTLVVAFCATLATAACGNPAPDAHPEGEGARGAAKPDAKAEPVTPPFAVQGELDGLLLVWFDGEGAHSAARRSDIPEAHRASVRVDSLAVPPDRRLDAEQVYVADVRSPRGDGGYPVFLRSRGWFDAQVEAARGAVPVAQAAPAGGASDVTLYMASWCGACRSAASYLRSRGVPFSEKDIEKDAQASAEMLRKARDAGKTPRGVPVIDFRGNILLGFDQRALDQLIDKYKAL